MTQPERRTTVRIAVDLLGGDSAPAVVVDGVLTALHADEQLSLLLVGPEAIATGIVASLPGALRPQVTLRPADQRIEMGDSPVSAVRSRPRATVRVAVEALHAGAVDAVVSAGSTGAVVAAARATLDLIPGVRRPALAAVIPAAAHPVLLLDAGASPDATDTDLISYSILGAAYARAALGVLEPRVGLLSLGTEVGKGDALRRRVSKLLPEMGLRYIGLVEGHDVPLGGPADVVVVDGFTGNVLLKGMEGTVEMVRQARGVTLADLAPRVAVMLGVVGVVVVGHGAATSEDIAGGIAVAATAVRGGHIERVIAAAAAVETLSSPPTDTAEEVLP